MSVFDQEEVPRTGGVGRVLAMGAGVIALLAAAYVGVTVLMPEKPAPKADPPPARSEPVARRAPKPVEPEAAPEEPKAARRPAPKKVAPAVAVVVPDAPAGPVLVIESDVPGASVFVDRKYLGTTPLRSTEVSAGTHQLNASASGEDGLVQTIDVNGTGDTTVTLKFREVRLSAQVAVIHKHTFGSCAGTLAATPAGISYQTDNAKDAFTIPLGALEAFEIEYLKKELKVKQRGGRTWNFTDKSDNADKLFVFHRDVSKAREKLAVLPK
ncbi:MAG: PEGA domain-containing protein [Acidobacteriota bacterium]